jgi:hypothetical protein
MRDIVVEPVGPKSLKAFVALPNRLMANDPMWVPQLDLERRMAMKAGGTPYLRRAETAKWIARRNGKAVGRIGAQIDPMAVARMPGIGHFGFIAAERDPEIFAALLHTAEDWLRARGMTHIRGPLNHSVNEETGLLVAGFDTPPSMMMPHDPPYAGTLIEQCGYAKAMDMFAYRLDPSRVPPPVQAIMARPAPSGVTVRPLRWNDYRNDVRSLVEIFNDAWSGNWGFVPFTDEEIDHLAGELKPLIVDRLVWFVEANGVAEGFLVCLPNLNEAIRDLNGKLLPFGWAKLLWRIKAAGLKTSRVPLMGVRRGTTKTLLGSLIPFLLFGALAREVQVRGIGEIEISWVLEINRPMRAVAEALCGAPCKTYRLYEKPLT